MSAGRREVRQVVEGLPGVRWLRARRFDALFAGGWAGSHRGVFRTFDEAARSAPRTKPVGFDHEAPAAMYEERHHQIYPSDYPVLFWLSRVATTEPLRVFDLGGHVGISFYAFRRVLELPTGSLWTVMDVPAAVRRGEELARARGVADRLRFTHDLDAASDADVLLAAGSLQFIDGPSLGARLRALPRRPRWVLVNKTPLTPHATFVTLQNAGTAYVPCRVTNADDFVAELRDAGYRVVDRWENADMGCLLPMEPALSVPRHSGVALLRE